MGDMNVWFGIGNLVRDPELRYTPNGTSVCNFTLAVNERWETKGKKQSHVEYTRIVAWGEMGERVAEELKKGSRCHVEGRLQTRTWEDKHKEKRYATEVVAVHVTRCGDPPEKARTAPNRDRGYASDEASGPDEPQSPPLERDANGDELPF